MRTIGILAAAVAAAALGGCVPFPHTERLQPAVDGVLTAGGVPLRGVTVRTCHGLPLLARDRAELGSCPHVVSTTTDAEGHFHFDSYSDVRWMLVMDAATASVIEVQGPGGPRAWRRIYWSPAPHGDTVRCELGDTLVCR